MKETLQANITTLDKILKVVVKVHGKEHPELHDIQSVYTVLREDLEEDKDPSLEILKIRELTDNYTLPDDACQAYTRVYDHLKRIDHEFAKH